MQRNYKIKLRKIFFCCLSNWIDYAHSDNFPYDLKLNGQYLTTKRVENCQYSIQIGKNRKYISLSSVQVKQEEAEGAFWFDILHQIKSSIFRERIEVPKYKYLATEGR